MLANGAASRLRQQSWLLQKSGGVRLQPVRADSSAIGGAGSIANEFAPTECVGLRRQADPGQGAFDGARIGRSDQPRHLLALVEENQRRPQRHSERPPQRTPLAVFDLDMTDFRVPGESLGEEGLRCLAVSTPGSTELEDGRLFQGFHCGARRFGRGIGSAHVHGAISKIRDTPC